MADSLLVYTDRATVVITLEDGDILKVMLEQRGVVLIVDVSLELAAAVAAAIAAQIAATVSENNAEASAIAAAASAGEASSASGGIMPLGGWDASVGINPPTPDAGTYPWYRITVDGNIPAVGDVHVGDNVYWEVLHNEWFKIDNTDRFTSINGYTSGVIDLTAEDINAVSIPRGKDTEGSLTLSAMIISPALNVYSLTLNRTYDGATEDIIFSAMVAEDGQGPLSTLQLSSIDNAPALSEAGYEIKILEGESYVRAPPLKTGILYTFKLNYAESDDEEVAGAYFLEVISGLAHTQSYIDEFAPSLGLDQSLSVGLEQLLNINYNSIQTINSGGDEGFGEALSTLHINPLGGPVRIGQQGEGPHFDNTVILFNNGGQVVRTVNASFGGLEVNNNATASGFERVLTLSDISGVALTPEDILDALSGVAGPGSGLDADTVDGRNASDFLRKASQTESFFGSSFSCHYGNEGIVRLTASPESPYGGPSLDFILNNTNATIKRIGWEDDGTNVGVPEGLTGVSIKQPNNADDLWLAVEGNIYSNTELVLTEGSKGSQSEIDAGIEDVLVTAMTLANYSGLGQSDISGITGLQSALDSKAEVLHTHTIANVTGLQTELDGKSNNGHLHSIANVTGLQTELDGKSNNGHLHSIANVTGLQSALDLKSDVAIAITIASVPGLQAELDGKAASVHSHAMGDVAGLQAALNGFVSEGDSPAFAGGTYSGVLGFLNDGNASEISAMDGADRHALQIFSGGQSPGLGAFIVLGATDDPGMPDQIVFGNASSVMMNLDDSGISISDLSIENAVVFQNLQNGANGGRIFSQNGSNSHYLSIQSAQSALLGAYINVYGSNDTTKPNSIEFGNASGTPLKVTNDGVFVKDGSNDFRKVGWKPRLITLGSNTTLNASHILHTIYVQTASTITIAPDFAENGDIIQVLTNTNAITIAEGASVFLEWQQGGTFEDGSRTVDQKSVVTLLCLGSNVWKIWGIGIT